MKHLSEEAQDVHIIDSRFNAHFRNGHIPTATNIPFNEILTPEGQFRTDEELAKIFSEKAFMKDPIEEKAILSCQSGISACILEAGLKQLGNKSTVVYDGSFEEWV
mmetsp:Transcript_11207/g.18857  ORF Transcript_11207/g.18857 Transcript_11207/m.18857 type:complete len:106 (+) Transcript_11207:609-926(+)